MHLLLLLAVTISLKVIIPMFQRLYGRHLQGGVNKVIGMIQQHYCARVRMHRM